MVPETPSRIPDGPRIGSIELTTRGIFEHSDDVRTMFVDRKTILGGALRHGFTSERLVVGSVFGGVLLAIGLRMLLLLLLESARPARAIYYVGFGGLTLVLMGLGLLRRSLHRGTYLHVRTTSGDRKLVIGKALRSDEVTQALLVAREQGYEFEPPSAS